MADDAIWDFMNDFLSGNISRELEMADINHCLSFEQVSEELIEDKQITTGQFDTVKECKYDVPSVLSIGRVYQQVVLAI